MTKSGKSTKSSSDSTPQTNKRFKYDRKRTLSRGSSFQFATVDDLKWIWASYKKAGFPSDFYPELREPDMNPQEFAARFEYVLLKYHMDCMILSAENGNGIRPVGFVLLWSRGRLLEISNFVWFEWATTRNKLESALNFLNQMRRTVHEPTGRNFKLIGLTQGKEQPFWRRLADYKVIRLVGKPNDIYADDECYLYETFR